MSSFALASPCHLLLHKTHVRVMAFFLSIDTASSIAQGVEKMGTIRVFVNTSPWSKGRQNNCESPGVRRLHFPSHTIQAADKPNVVAAGCLIILEQQFSCFVARVVSEPRIPQGFFPQILNIFSSRFVTKIHGRP